MKYLLRYAKALLMVSDEAKILKILSDFKSLIETINSNKNFTDLISNPLINSVKKAKVLK